MSKRILSLVAVVVILFGSFGVLHVQATGGVKGISAKALTDHECNSSEWHFVITQIDTLAHAPGSITVNWANGSTAVVSRNAYTGHTAHYTTTLNLTSTVTSASAVIYSGWSGEFNLSHGPCNPVNPPVDVCPNIEGNQATVPEGMVKDESGNCVTPPPPPEDLCLNLEGVQTQVPDGLVRNADGNCVTPPPPPEDLCLNLEGVQTQVPDGLVRNADGNCVTPPPPTEKPKPTNTPVVPTPEQPYQEPWTGLCKQWGIADAPYYFTEENGTAYGPNPIGKSGDEIWFGGTFSEVKGKTFILWVGGVKRDTFLVYDQLDVNSKVWCKGLTAPALPATGADEYPPEGGNSTGFILMIAGLAVAGFALTAGLIARK